MEVHNLYTYLNPTATNPITGNLGTLEIYAVLERRGIYSGSARKTPTWYKNFRTASRRCAFSIDPKTVIRASYLLTYAHGNNIGGAVDGWSVAVRVLRPRPRLASGLSSAPAFYWDQANAAGTSTCTGGIYTGSGGVACGWTGSIVAPATAISSTLGGNGSLGHLWHGQYDALTTGPYAKASSSSPAYYDPYLAGRAPEYGNWNFGIEREITKDMAINISYVGSEGHFVSIANAVGARNGFLPESLSAMAGYNVVSGALVPCSGTGCTAPLLTQKATAANLALAVTAGFTPPNPYNPANATYYASNSVFQYYLAFPQYKSITDGTSFVGNSNFNALEVTLKQRTAHGLDVMINYTYSKTIDDLGTFRTGDNTRLDRSLSTADQPQNLAATAVYQLPFGRGHIGGNNFMVRALASDWGLSTIVTLSLRLPHRHYRLWVRNFVNPQPVHAEHVVSGNAGRINGAYGKLSRAAILQPHHHPAVPESQRLHGFGLNSSSTAVGTVTATSSAQSTNVWHTAPHFTSPGTPPASRRSTSGNESLFNVDFGLKRTFPLYENFKLLFEVDDLNAMNHVVFAAPGAVVNGGAAFGELTSVANTARDFQLSARITW